MSLKSAPEIRHDFSNMKSTLQGQKLYKVLSLWSSYLLWKSALIQAVKVVRRPRAVPELERVLDGARHIVFRTLHRFSGCISKRQIRGNSGRQRAPCAVCVLRLNAFRCKAYMLFTIEQNIDRVTCKVSSLYKHSFTAPLCKSALLQHTYRLPSQCASR